MNRNSRLLATAFALAVIAGVVIHFHQRSPVGQPSLAGSPGIPNKTASEASSPSKPEPSAAADPVAELHARLEATLAQLSASQDAEANRKLLAELRTYLATLPPAEASLAIQSFLAESRDAATKLDVTINSGGSLDDSSSLRVFLLDYLGLIDRPAAGTLATQVLSHYTTPDEWAVSLRNYAWANPGLASEAYLQTKARELIANPAWTKEPSSGFLEAFDSIVYAHGTALTPELTTLVRDKDNRATAHAAYLTLDRLTIAEPATTLKQLLDQPDLMKGREQTRANYFARADVRQPEQRALVEQYLIDPARTSEELATIAGLYPNANYMISNNLLTTVQTPKHEELAAQDQEALRAVEQWQVDPRFDHLKPQLAQIRQRLAEFVRQAAQNR